MKVAAGLVTVAAAPLSPERGLLLMFAAVMVAGLIPLVYSYMAWRRERSEV